MATIRLKLIGWKISISRPTHSEVHDKPKENLCLSLEQTARLVPEWGRTEVRRYGSRKP